MTDRRANATCSVLIIHPDYQFANEIGTLIKRSGRYCDVRTDSAPNRSTIESRQWDSVFVAGEIFAAEPDTTVSALRSYLHPSTVLVGVLDSSLIESPTLVGAGVDLILYQPLVLADIERALAYAKAVQFETREQARDRLRKLTALQELAVASGHRSSTPGWMNNLVRAGAEILGADALAMWSVDRQHEAIRCIGSVGLTDEYICSAEERSAAVLEIYDELPQHLTSSWIVDSSADSDVSSVRILAPEAARTLGIQKLAWLPVRDSNRVYGHLSFYFMSEATFEKYDLLLADAFASIVAAGLGTFWLESEIRRTNRLYREHVESSPDGVVVCHPDGTIERSNPAVERITGRDQYEIIGQSIFDWLVSPRHFPWNEWLRSDVDEPGPAIELWLTRVSGERRRVSCFARRVTFPDPRRLDETEHRVQVVLRDVTESARRLVELEIFHDLTRLISQRGALPDAYELVVSRLFNYLNYRLVTIGSVVDSTQLQLEAYRTSSPEIEVPQRMDVSFGLCGRAVRRNESMLVTDVLSDPDYFGIDDDVCCELVSIIRANDEPFGIINVQSDARQPLDENDLQLVDSIAAHLGLLIEQLSAQERLERQALTDPLTGMANRRAFMQKLQALAASEGSTPAALLLVELDNFKGINDRYGHLFGDEMLKQVAHRLQTGLRNEDVLARYGGDEIAMIFYDITSTEARQIAERLRSTISDEPFMYNGAIAHLTVSIGISLFPHHGRTTDELIGEADRRMYAAKLEGRNSVHGEIPLAD